MAGFLSSAVRGGLLTSLGAKQLHPLQPKMQHEYVRQHATSTQQATYLSGGVKGVLLTDPGEEDFNQSMPKWDMKKSVNGWATSYAIWETTDDLNSEWRL
jgi:hypothetical protein